jgi:hydrogenase maturation protease
VVLGVGSPLMGDDGLGIAVLELLRDRWAAQGGLELLDGGTWGMRLLPFIEAARNLLVIDVIRDGRDPGTIVRLERDELPRHLHQKLSPHQIDLGEVLALAELRGTLPAEVVALGIEPDVVELGEGLSAAVEAAIPALVAAVRAQLETWGLELTSREPTEVTGRA